MEHLARLVIGLLFLASSSFLGVMVRSSMNLSTDIIASTISGAGIIILIYIIGDILLSVLVDDYDDYL